MKKEQKLGQADELSRSLDSLNAGRQPAVQDEEVRELLEVAVLVKQSYHQADVPRLLIDEMAGKLAVELGTQQKKRRVPWLYGGLIGAAAAVVIAIAVQFLLPQPPEHNIALQMDANKTQKMTAADQASEPIRADSANQLLSPQPPAAESTPSTVPVLPEEKPLDGVSKAIDQKSNQMAMLSPETPGNTAMRQSAAMAKTTITSSQEAKTVQPERKVAKMLVLPDQAAQSITVDTTSGIIQQVYNLDNNDEIIITQSPLAESGAKTRTSAKQDEGANAKMPVAQPAAGQAEAAVLNSVTVRVDQYDVKVEGKKSTEELKKIALSLIVQEIEQ